jgi:hypothetical protein
MLRQARFRYGERNLIQYVTPPCVASVVPARRAIVQMAVSLSERRVEPARRGP